MDWLEFRPWSRDVERFCRSLLEDPGRHLPRAPTAPPHADQRAQLEEYRASCHVLLDLSGDNTPSNAARLS